MSFKSDLLRSTLSFFLKLRSALFRRPVAESALDRVWGILYTLPLFGVTAGVLFGVLRYGLSARLTGKAA